MGIKQLAQVFEARKVRTAWDDDTQKWYFAVVDVVEVLTDSANAKSYWKVLKHRLRAEGNEVVTICNQLKLRAADGKMYMTDVADIEGIFRIIQSIPSKKAEPVKKWLATPALTSKAVLVEASSPQSVHQTTSAPSRRRAPTRYHSQRRNRMSEIIPES